MLTRRSPGRLLRSALALALLLLSPALAAAQAAPKKIAFVAGNPSHGYGSHEHFAGCKLLARSLEEALGEQVKVTVHQNGWPRPANALDDADVVVIYSDGGGGHPVNRHLKQVDALVEKGVGLVCLHYAVEVPKGEPGDHFLKWLGGYFETHWSVNPHWTAEFKTLPEHPITRGVQPFAINDEWYYHMRFRDGLEGVTPILTAIPPASTLRRPDGPHSGNPHVRAKAGQPQHVAWATENAAGSRGFGFTGGHFHWNWGDANFRTIVLNAICWTAHLEVPANGVRSQPLTLQRLEENQDYPQPKNFDGEAIRRRLNLPAGAAKPGAARTGRGPAPIYRSPLVTPQTPGHAVAIKADIRGAKELYLVVEDGGDGFSCDWADWAEPRLVGPQGEKRLTELKWREARSQWGQPGIGKNAGGQPLRIGGQAVSYGIGTHANSLIAFELPEGYSSFEARGGLDNGGTDQGACGAQSSVRFAVYTQRPAASASGPAPPASRDPAHATEGLDVAEGLAATLFASEPDLLSLTNLDIDHRGRIWVCEVVNYRRHNGRREAGDRILILEDKDGDGQADSQKVFYQGRDIDSAMGICVLGKRVIVSCSPNVLVFTDENGDDVPDKKEVLFSKTGQPQHDHSAHSFLFGPDGKLYWNFGNTGQAVHDAAGNEVVDQAGNHVVDNGKPYYGGMPFRCNLDGSEFEVLGHNFRNNYEVTVDSFGTLWQSDNDDDGNRGVRINYVMEFGNYGYRDQVTGAGWREPRTGMHEDVPLRHWHLRDPGVVPNLLQTGAGSPTGITVYEGRLLPKVFWDQVIHCDAGPNVVRAYPVKSQGAGYEASIVNVLHGARDNWFRPADVCVAPDGSLFVTDWYDPGVGGHNMQDLERGRLFRVAPPGTAYRVPKFDFSTPAGAIEALKNPNLSVRYMAWTALHGMGEKAVEPLLATFREDDNPRFRARALWLLGKLPGNSLKYVELALEDPNPDLRIVALRLARQTAPDHLPAVVAKLVEDPSAAVRRECAIALRGLSAEQTAPLWATLAARHDGKDRWYLEALGIAADGKWDACLAAYLKQAGKADATAAGRDLIWRSRSEETPALLAEIIATQPVENLPRYLRALDFQSGKLKEQVLAKLAFEGVGATPQAKLLIAAEAIKRLGSFDLQASPQYAAALHKLLDQMGRNQQFVDLVARFNVTERYPELLQLAQSQPDTSEGVAAITALLGKRQFPLIAQALRGEDAARASATATVLGNSADGRIAGLLLPLVKDAKADLELRRQATRGLAKTRNGGSALIELAQSEELDPDLKSAASFLLNSSNFREVREAAARLFPLPNAKNSPLPPIDQLVALRGNAGRGAEIFRKTGQCSSCHQVGQEGKEVGPSLTEIGSKLSRQALIESILYPSAGISHNYESYTLVLNDGNVVTGILLSQTDDSVTIRTKEAITRSFPRKDLDVLKRMPISLMPADLQKTMTAEDLVDVVEYLTTLKKKP